MIEILPPETRDLTNREGTRSWTACWVSDLRGFHSQLNSWAGCGSSFVLSASGSTTTFSAGAAGLVFPLPALLSSKPAGPTAGALAAPCEFPHPRLSTRCRLDSGPILLNHVAPGKNGTLSGAGEGGSSSHPAGSIFGINEALSLWGVTSV